MNIFVLTLKLRTELFQEHFIDKQFEKCRKIYNACISELFKRYNHMIESKVYQKNCKYKGNDRNKIFQEINKQYNLTEYSLHAFVKPMYNYFEIDSHIAQKLATRAFKAFEKYMYHQAKKVNYISYDELHSIEGKSNKQAIKFRDNVVKWQGLKIPVIIKDNDMYVYQALESKIKYCRLLKKPTGYYAQLILDGIPPTKITTQGEIRGKIGTGKVGIDIGTQTLAYSSDYEVKLLELAPNVNNIDRELKLLQRKMDRSRRATNPNKYNDDGIIKKDNKDKWKYSNHYLKLKEKRKKLFDKQSKIRKQDHNILANNLISLGNEFYVETMNFKGLQARAKKTEKNDKGKFKKKKRFGKSLANKSPSMFLTILNNKLKWNVTELYKIDTFKVKASQYSHITNEYNKKELNERWNTDIGIQRDLYSAFLIMNIKENLKEIDRDLCFNTFEKFKELHDIEIKRLTSNELPRALKNVI